MSLVDQLFISSVWTDSDVRGSNTTGTPVTSAVLSGTGEEISDTYTITMSAVSAGTGTATVAASGNNPFNGKVVTGVPLDGSSVVKNVVPGVSIVFSAGTANGNVASIVLGDPYGAFDASGISAGVPTTGVRHRVHNTGTGDVADAKVTLLTQSIQYKITGKVFNYVKPFAPGSTEKIAGGGSSRVMPYALTISGVTGSGLSKVATLSVDGVALGAGSLLDLTTGGTVSGTGIKATVTPYPYRVATGPLTGLEFALDSACVNADKANVLIFPSRYVQIAPDVAGVEGTYDVTDVVLTTAGQSAGVILAGDVAYYWTRFLVPASANNESNPYPCDIGLQASQSTAAGWGA